MQESTELLLSEIRELVLETARALEIDPPVSLFEYGQEAGAGETEWYLVGLIGGKEVGKSALVNALAGERITESTSFGPGTEKAVAYVHRDRAKSVREFLEREIPNRFEMVEHDKAPLNRQVLLDLPDIDSHYTTHFETVRKLLRFILFPVWIQSLEKYADRQPMELLRNVVRGNAPENFLYCLNKADQLEHTGGDSALAEIAEDYRGRLERAVGLNGGGGVFLLSALHPERYDLPRLREILSTQKEETEIAASRRLASRRFSASLLAWVADRKVAERLERTERMEEHLASLLGGRIEGPLFETLLPAIRGDERVETFLFGRAFRSRIQRWPILRSVDALAGPLRRLFGRSSARDSVELRGLTREAIERAFGWLDPPLDRSVQACFAHLRGSFPHIANLYVDRRLWEEGEAREAVADLRRRLALAHSSLVAKALERVEVGRNPIGAVYRHLLAYGALIWFPFGQPVLEHLLREEAFGDIALLLVRLFGVASLLQSAVFLILFFGSIWLAVRWRAHRRASRAFRTIEEAGGDSGGTLETAVREWGELLAAPLFQERERFLELERKRENLEARLSEETE